MSKECLTCGIVSDNKNYYELSGKVTPKFICKECANELGIRNFLIAGFHTNTSILKKYVKIHPEAQPRIEALLESIEGKKAEKRKETQKYNDDLKNSIKEKFEKMNKRSGCKKEKQIKCVCISCQNIYYYGEYDKLKNFINTLNGSIYSVNQYKDLGQCPKCGSRAISKKDIYFWVDKKGNCVDVEE